MATPTVSTPIEMKAVGTAVDKPVEGSAITSEVTTPMDWDCPVCLESFQPHNSNGRLPLRLKCGDIKQLDYYKKTFLNFFLQIGHSFCSVCTNKLSAQTNGSIT